MIRKRLCQRSCGRPWAELLCLYPSLMLLTISGAQAGTVFTDDFAGPSLDPAWEVLSGQGSYSLLGGQLRYYNSGNTASTTGWYNAALTLALPFTGANWEIDTKATYNLAWCLSGSYTGPSVPNPGCSSGSQGPEVLVKFDPGVITSSSGGPNYAGTDYTVIERVVDAYYGANVLTAGYGATTSGNLLNPADANITDNLADGTYWYRIIRSGGSLSIDYSRDGTNYLNALSTTLSNPSGTYNELLLGGITYLGAGSYTDYDFVKISTPAPEPGTFCVIGLGLIPLVWKYRVRKRA